MIQRIQTIFLFLAAACFLTLFAFPFGISDVPETGMLADSRYDVYDHILLIILTVLGSLVALIAIFLYRNRRRQMTFGIIGIIAAILIPILVILLFASEAGSMQATSKVEEQIGLFMPLGALIFLLLANRFIKKDEKLVKSMDRLR
jgi:small-conductance mechanosensitive channel